MIVMGIGDRGVICVSGVRHNRLSPGARPPDPGRAAQYPAVGGAGLSPPRIGVKYPAHGRGLSRAKSRPPGWLLPASRARETRGRGVSCRPRGPGLLRPVNTSYPLRA